MAYLITFHRSRSPAYARAVAIADRLPGARLGVVDGAAAHQVPVAAGSFATLGEMLPLIRHWRGAALWRDDVRLPPGALARLAAVVACTQERGASGGATWHCRAWAPDGLPCQIVARRLPWGFSRNPGDAPVRAALVRTVARGACADACPWYDEAAVTAALERQCAQDRGDGTAPPPGAGRDERAWLARLLADVDWGEGP